jgi:hypothetical protein
MHWDPSGISDLSNNVMVVFMCSDDALGIVTDYGLHDKGVGIRLPARKITFSTRSIVIQGLTHILIHRVMGHIFWRPKWTGSNSSHSEWHIKIWYLPHRNHITSTLRNQQVHFIYRFERIEVFMAVTMKNAVFWDVTPSGSCKNRRFGGPYHLHYQCDKYRRAKNNVSRNYKPKNTAKI